MRAVAAADVAAVRQVLVETWHDTYDRLIGAARVTEITDDWHAIDALAGGICRIDHAFLLVELGDRVIATGSAMRGEGVVEVQRLYVHPSGQGQGVGVLLLDALLARLGAMPRVEVSVMLGNTRAQAFYEREGFVAHGRDDEHVLMHRSAT